MTNAKTPDKDKAATPGAVVPGAAKRQGAAPSAAARKTKRAPAGPAAEPRAAATPKPAMAAEPVLPKSKLVRDSFTIPKSEYAVLDALKLRAARLMRPTKKSEVLRAGIAALAAMSDEAFLVSINGIPSLKTGRPKASSPAGKPAPK